MLPRRRTILPLVVALGMVVQYLFHAHPFDPYHHTRACRDSTGARGGQPEGHRPAMPHSHHACAPCSAPAAHATPQAGAVPPPTRLGQLPVEPFPAPPARVSRRGIDLRGPPSA